MILGALVVVYKSDYNSLYSKFRELASQVDYLVVVDNTPDIDKKDIFFNNVHNIIYIDMHFNSGIACAQNKAINELLHYKADYIFIFDQDTYIDNHYVQSMITSYLEIEKTTKIGALGPLYLDVKNNKLSMYGKLKGFKHIPFDRHSDKEFESVDMVIASGCLIASTVFQEVGLMDEKLFIDCVDTEWCLRANSKGYLTYIAKKIILKHNLGDKLETVNGEEINVHSKVRVYYMVRNNLYLAFWSNYGFFQRVKFIFFSFRYLYLYWYIYGLLFSIHVLFVAFKNALIKKMGALT